MMSEPTEPMKAMPPKRRTPRYAADGQLVRRAGGKRKVDDTFEDLLDAFTTHLKEVRCLSFGTQDSYAKSARTYYRWLVATEPAVVLTEASSATIRAYLTFRRDQKISPGTIATYLYALKSFYDFLFLDDPDRSNPAKGVKGPKVIEAPIDPLTEDEVRLLLTITQHHEHSDDLRRWVGYVALTLLAGTGVRNAELRDLQTHNIDLARHQLKVIGKGSKVRIIPFGPGTAQVLATYLKELRPRLAPSAYFIVNPLSLRNGPNWGRMGEKSLVDLLKVLLTEADISGKANPHRFRHSYATLTTSKTGNVELTRQLMGHSDISTTIRYIHTAMKDRHDAADGVDLVPVSDVTDPIEPLTPETPAPPDQGTLPVPPTATDGEKLPGDNLPGDNVPVGEPLGENLRGDNLLGESPPREAPAGTPGHNPPGEQNPPVEPSAPAHPTAPASLIARDFHGPDTVADREGGPHPGDLRGGAEAILADAVEVARHLPPQLLGHLDSECIVEVALASLITTGLQSEVLLPTAALVLARSKRLPVQLGPLLNAYGTDVTDALLQVRRTLELLSGLDPAGSQPGSCR